MIKEKLFSNPLENSKKNIAWMDNQFDKIFNDVQKEVLIKSKIININSDYETHNYFFRLKKSYIGNKCVNFFKSIPLARNIARNINKILKYCHYLSILTFRKKYKISKLEDYVKAKKLAKFKLFNSSKVMTPEPTVIPIEDQQILQSPHDFYNSPPIYNVELYEAKIYGKTNFVKIM